MGRWVWPEGLKPLWEDSVTSKEKAYRQGRELDEAVSKYYAEHGGGDVMLDPDSQKELDKREMEHVRDMAGEYMARNRVSLVDKFMESDLVKAALKDKKDAGEIRKWAGELLGIGKFKPSDIEIEVAKSLKGDRSILDTLPVEARRALYSLAEREALRKKELNALNGIKSRELQGYRRENANTLLEDWEVNREMRRLELLAMSNLLNGKGAMVPVYGSAGSMVEIPGLEGMDVTSLDDKIIRHMLGKFRGSGYMPEMQDIDETDGLSQVRTLDKAIGGATGKAGRVLREELSPDSDVVVTTLYGPGKKPLKEHLQDMSSQWLADPLYKEAHDSYFSKPKSFLPEDWEGGYPFVIYPPDGSSDLIVFEEDGSIPRVVTEDDTDYAKFRGRVYVPPVSDSRMKKQKRKGMTSAGRLGSFLSSSQFRIGGE